MKLQNNYITISYKINLNNLDDELQNPKFQSLINQNYNIKAIIPVEDSGNPTAIIILSNQPLQKTVNYPYITLITFMAVLFQFALYYLTNTT